MTDTTFLSLWIGDDAESTFSEPLATLRRQGPIVICRTFADAFALAGDGVQLIVVAERFAGEHSPNGFDTLRRLRPATPLVRLCGSWCEGELRTLPPPAAMRYSWLTASTVWVRDFATFQRGECPSWGHPLTLTDQERLSDVSVSGCSAVRPIVGVIARDEAMAAWLCETLGRQFGDVIRIPVAAKSARHADVVVWNVPSSRNLQRMELSLILDQTPSPAVIALVDFPRIDDVARLTKAGVRRVLAKPVCLGDLEAAISDAADAVGASIA